MKIVIVGGVAGGMSAATRLRRLHEDAQIVVFERGAHVSFANCGLPYYVGGVIEERSALLLQTSESLRARFALDVHVRHEVVGIDRDARAVVVRDVETGEERTESYDELILATGAAPLLPEVEGIERALSLRDVADVDALDAAAQQAASAVVIGAGFIGLELAENLVRRGVKVTIVELSEQVLPPLDPELAVVVQQTLTDNGVDVRLGTQVAAVGGRDVTLADGSRVPADLVVAAIGVRPESGLASEAGLRVGSRGGIVVDEFQRTSDPHIYAVGDAVEKRDAVDHSPTMVPLAGPANRQGRLAADAIAGLDVRNAPVLGTAIVGVFDRQAALTGWSEKRLRAAGVDYVAIATHPVNHAGYYPGAEQMSLKLLFEPGTGRILGAQAVGGAGVDKRIDVIATAMRGGITAAQLIDLDLSYAPQFGSAKDPINMLGYVADNVLSGATPVVRWDELDGLGWPVVDVRTPAEFEAGAIPGSINIPLDDLRERLTEVPERCVVTCQVGLRGHIATRLLRQHGRDVVNLTGGYQTWSTAQSVAKQGA